jgi:hypothetical protein
MNTKELSKQVGSLFKLRPQPLRVDGAGNRLPPSDDDWRLHEVLQGQARIRLTNISTGHTMQLEWDNVLERRSPAFLMLRCQLTLRPRSIEIEPIHKGTPIQPSPEPVPLSSLEAEAAKVPLLSRGAVWETFNGVPASCHGRLGSLTPLPGSKMRVGMIGDNTFDIWFEVKSADYPRLATARGDERVHAVGLYHSYPVGHWLDEARLTFLT